MSGGGPASGPFPASDHHTTIPGESNVSLFITFEGPEGAGKSTQIRLLSAALQQQGISVVITREPGGTEIGNAIRTLLLDPKYAEMSPRTETLLFNAARAQVVDEVIRPALEAGHLVLCDRFADSTLAYQGYGYGQDLALLRMIGGYATTDLRPNLTIYLDIDVRVGLGRKRGGSAQEWNRMEEKTLVYHQEVRQGYLALAAAEPQRWLVIDASLPLEVVHQAIRARLLAVLHRYRITAGRSTNNG